MNSSKFTLAASTRSSIIWFSSAFVQLVRADMGRVFLNVAALFVSRITGLMALFMPLKVILLVGSEGVPRYFAFLVSPDEKMLWVGVFSVGAVLAFVATVFLESWSSRLTAVIAHTVLARANQLGIVSKEYELSLKHCERIVSCVSDVVFFVVVGAAVALLDLALFVLLFSILLAQYFLTVLVVRDVNQASRGRFDGWILSSPREYLQILSTVAFLSGFFLILSRFIPDLEGNILVAILSILLMRRGFSALVSSVVSLIKLSAAREKIDPLLFREVQANDGLGGRDDSIEKFYDARGNRLKRVEERMRLVDSSLILKDMQWLDCSLPAMATFLLDAEDAKGKRRLQLQIYESSKKKLLEHEDLLFDFVDRGRLGAPKRFMRYDDNGLGAQIVDFPVFEEGDDWNLKKVKIKLVCNLWSVEPSFDLIDRYMTTRSPLGQRISEDWIRALGPALDDDASVKAAEEFRYCISEIVHRIESIPLRIGVAKVHPNDIAMTNNGPILMNWSSWFIEPMGFRLPSWLDEEELIDILASHSFFKSGNPDDEISIDDLLLVDEISRLENQIQTRQLKAALELMQGIAERLNNVR